jgi:hypothetical protein
MDKVERAPRSTEGLPELVTGLVGDLSSLFRKEIELAKTEASEKVSQAIHGAEFIVAGAILALGALGVLLAAIVTVLGAWFTAMGMEPLLANSLSALIVAIVVGLIAWMLISSGLRRVRETSLQMNRTAASLSSDAALVKERL